MPNPASMANLWPGFVAAWRWGSARGFALALAFGLALNLALVATFGGTVRLLGLPAGAMAAAAWVLVLSLWVLGLVWLRRDGAQGSGAPAESTTPELDGWFAEAQAQYLQGHWIEAETLVCRVLSQRPADAEAALLLASIERRTERRSEAKRRLLKLKDDAVATKWWLEIERELEQLAAAEKPALNIEALSNESSTSHSLPKAA